jgi:dimethylargininase
MVSRAARLTSAIRYHGQVRSEPMNGTSLVRRPGSRLAEGIVTHISRTPVDVALARAQHAAYADALASSGWMIQQAPAADDCPDSVFIEDTVVICEDLAVLTRPGAPARRAEVAGVAQAVRSLGLRTVCIEEPGVLDGGDVLQAGNTVYTGRGGRTNGEGIRQLRSLLAPLGRTVIAVPLRNVLHLKSAVTALPDGTFLLLPGLVPAELWPRKHPVRLSARASSRRCPAARSVLSTRFAAVRRAAASTFRAIPNSQADSLPREAW